MSRFFGCLLIFIFGVIHADVSPLVAQGEEPHPLQQMRTLNSDFPFLVPETLGQWRQQREKLRQHLQVSLGLWPMPSRTPLIPIIHGKLDMGEYSIEKVIFESFPGFFVTGNLYRPARPERFSANGKLPAVLCPHGHFPEGRFLWVSDEKLQQEMVSGAEEFPSNGRSPLQARCANLAIRGCVVFHYDMLGYADSQQITYDLAHGFRKQRPEMNGLEAWGFYSPQAELRLQSVMGLQTWNSIRSLDFLCELPDVDIERIGVTGCSGGGTQTFILCALDARPAAAFPAVMVSTAMQGGCTCENCCNLRIAAGNVDFAALFAPKPLGLTAADDWTVNMPNKGFPELESLYRLYREQDANVVMPQLHANLNFPHNFNQVSREAMYRFFQKHLSLAGEVATDEQEIVVKTAAELTVYNERYPRPTWSDEQERALLKGWMEASTLSSKGDKVITKKQIQDLLTLLAVALQSIVSHPDSLLEFRPILEETFDREKGPPVERIKGSLVAKENGLKTDLDLLMPGSNQVGIDTVLLTLDQQGWDPKKKINGPLTQRSRMPDSGNLLAHLTISQFPDTNRMTPNGRESAGYTFGYNRSVFAWRVSQVLYAVEYLSSRYPQAKIKIQTHIEGLAPVAAMAFSATSNPQVQALDCPLNGFRFAQVTRFQDPNFLPGGARYKDVLGFLATKPNGFITL
ncbi:MAG: hypothetical protein P8J33_00010, partial [Pirellulaceae bacterium]|nr:hypothetical protein [Pirellulaceae bacterium]